MAFNCYNCGRRRSKKELGRRVDDRNICTFCAPYVDDQDIGGMLAFESSMKAPKKKPPGSSARKNK